MNFVSSRTCPLREHALSTIAIFCKVYVCRKTSSQRTCFLHHDYSFEGLLSSSFLLRNMALCAVWGSIQKILTFFICPKRICSHGDSDRPKLLTMLTHRKKIYRYIPSPFFHWPFVISRLSGHFWSLWLWAPHLARASSANANVASPATPGLP